MKFASSLSALLVVLPLISTVSGLAVPESALAARQKGGQGAKNAQAAKAAQAAQAAKAAQANKGAQAAKGGQTAAQAAAAAQASKAAAAAAPAKAGKGGAAATGAAATGAAATGGAATAAPPAAAANTGNNAAAAGGNNAAAAAGGDLQSSLTLSPTVIQTTDDGQNPPVTGQSAALTSKNNFMNICAQTLPKTPLTNGLQITTGSCNGIPIGQIPAVTQMPSSKFQSPKNLDTVAANTAFDIVLQTQGIQLGTFTNAQKTYFANPQTLNAQGQIIGHTHIVIEAIDAIDTVKITNPQQFIFFKGVNDAQDGQGNVKVNVAGGLKAGAYRMCTIVSSSTHQPAIVPVAQHGSLDDCIYYTVA